MVSVQVFTDCVLHCPILPLYPLYIGEIVVIAVAPCVLLLIPLIVSIVCAVRLYNKKELNIKLKVKMKVIQK